MKNRPFLPALFICLFLIGSCSFDYEQAEIAGTLSKGVPNTIVRNYSYVDIRPGRTSFRIYASGAKMYHEAHLTTLEDVFFQEIDEDGEVVTEGEAGSAEIDTQTDNISITGSIHLVSTIHEMTIEAEYLLWNNASRSLEGKPEEEVFLEKADGTTIRGKGFSVDSPSRTIQFTSAVEGVYVYSDEKQE